MKLEHSIDKYPSNEDTLRWLNWFLWDLENNPNYSWNKEKVANA